MPEIKVIANPQAGRGRGRDTIAYVARMLPGTGLEFDVSLTEYPGHAIQLAHLAVAEGYRTIVALGGDGTVNEIINGLCMGRGDDPRPADIVKLGVIPAGSGNDFAYAVGLPRNVNQSLDRLVAGNTRLVDLGRINDRFFAYGVGIGLDAQVNIESQKIRRLRGMLLYFIALLKVLVFRHRTYELEINIDGTQLKQQTLLMSVANGRRTAGAFLLTPNAKVDDGLLSLCIIAPVSKLDMIRFLPLVFKGYHTKLSAVKTFDARRVQVRSDSPLATHVDGEVFGLGERCFEFSLLPHSLRVIC